MQKKLFPILIIALCACSNATPSVSTPEADPQFPYHGIMLDSVGTYDATFFLQFEGEKPYLYKADYRSDGTSVERTLHIEGVEAAQNPGDIRMVTQEGINYMSGPGTDGECLVFAAEADMGPAFLLPDQLLPPGAINPALQELGEDSVAGLPATRWGLRNDRLAGWTDTLVDIWQKDPDGPTLRYDLQLTGEDPFFGHGSGQLSGQFIVQSLNPPMIEPIIGCDIEFAIPESAENLLKLPGLLAFDSPGNVNIAADFFYENLGQDGWALAEEPAQAGETLILSFQKDGRNLDVVIEAGDDRVHVELLTENQVLTNDP